MTTTVFIQCRKPAYVLCITFKIIYFLKEKQPINLLKYLLKIMVLRNGKIFSLPEKCLIVFRKGWGTFCDFILKVK